MRPDLLKSDLALRFYVLTTLRFLDLQVLRRTRIRGRKESITPKPGRIVPWKVLKRAREGGWKVRGLF